MKIIIGLGNPGKKYEITRHNVGFLALDEVIRYESEIKDKEQKHQVLDINCLQSFKLEKRFGAEIAKLRTGGEDIILVKPQTFMNLSGESVKKVVDFYKVNSNKDLIVIHDDIDLPLGSVRIKFKGSSAGHKGVQSIINNLSTEGFMRVRMGVGRPENDQIKIEDWVLQKFSKEELEIVRKVFVNLIKQAIKYL